MIHMMQHQKFASEPASYRSNLVEQHTWRFPKIMAIIIFGDLCWGPPTYANYIINQGFLVCTLKLVLLEGFPNIALT